MFLHLGIMFLLFIFLFLSLCLPLSLSLVYSFFLAGFLFLSRWLCLSFSLSSFFSLCFLLYFLCLPLFPLCLTFLSLFNLCVLFVSLCFSHPFSCHFLSCSPTVFLSIERNVTRARAQNKRTLKIEKSFFAQKSFQKHKTFFSSAKYWSLFKFDPEILLLGFWGRVSSMALQLFLVGLIFFSNSFTEMDLLQPI